jgi:hypothetical protein
VAKSLESLVGISVQLEEAVRQGLLFTLTKILSPKFLSPKLSSKELSSKESLSLLSYIRGRLKKT